jgi:hypothetical protein
MSVAINGTNGITYNDGSLQPSAPVGKNRIINGNMAIDQRTTTQTGNGYSVDRWAIYDNTSATYTLAQDSSAPTGFINSLKFTTTGTDTSIGSTEQCVIYHQIEGNNIADLNWGTANAKTVTLSFYVRSSLTGTFAGSLGNNGYARSYPFTYTISSADTWEQKTITITGDTTGTWLTTNGVGISLRLAIAAGSSFEATAGAWASGNYFSVSGATNVVGTASSTFYITGVQLEANTTATPFENLQYGQQLALCQRYFQKSWEQGDAVGSTVSETTNTTQQSWGGLNASSIAGQCFLLPVTMRATPTLVIYDLALTTGKVTIIGAGAGATNNITPNLTNADANRFFVRLYGNNTAGMIFAHTLSAEL